MRSAALRVYRRCLPEIAPQGHFLALRAHGATSTFGLLAMTTQGRTGSQPALLRRHKQTLPPGGGRVFSLSKKSLRDFSPSCFQNCKMKFCSIILQFCRCGGLLNAKGNPDGFLSHFSSLRNLRLGRFFDSLGRLCGCTVSPQFIQPASSVTAMPASTLKP